MNSLANKKCVPCEKGARPLAAGKIQEYLAELSSPWELADNGTKIRREFMFDDFSSALTFINKVGALAEEEGHHPDIHNFYNRVVLELWTHAAGGLHQNDFIMAEKINQTAPK